MREEEENGERSTEFVLLDANTRESHICTPTSLASQTDMRWSLPTGTDVLNIRTADIAQDLLVLSMGVDGSWYDGFFRFKD